MARHRQRPRVSPHVLRLVACPRPREIRDRALLTLSFSACLKAGELRDLRLDHVKRTDEGLLLSVPGRLELTAVPYAREEGRCPVRAWDAWARLLRSQAATLDVPAF